MDFSNIHGDVVGMVLPNGSVKVVRGSSEQVGRVFVSESAFYAEYQKVNEGTGTVPECFIIQSING